MSFKNRLSRAVSGATGGSSSNQFSNIDLDPSEIYIQIHPSGHLRIELPEQRIAYLPASDFENGVMAGESLNKF